LNLTPDFATSEAAFLYLPEPKLVAKHKYSAPSHQDVLDSAVAWWVSLGLTLGALLIPLATAKVPPLPAPSP
jgi:hypothetical protein